MFRKHIFITKSLTGNDVFKNKIVNWIILQQYAQKVINEAFHWLNHFTTQ